MTLLEYLISIDKNKIIQADGFSQGIYMELKAAGSERQFDIITYPFLKECIGPFFLPTCNKDYIQYIDGRAFEFLSKTDLIIDKEVENYRSDTRRPYFRLRGRKVTEQQAFEIIRKTDNFFVELDVFSDWREYAHLGLNRINAIELLHIPNWWLNRNHIPTHYGWCHPSGIIGGNLITDKYPEIDELLRDIVVLKYAFPYLDFVMAITNWDEVSPEKYLLEKTVGYNIEALRKLNYMEFEGFLDSIELGIWIHDDTIEFMEPGRTRAKYEEYEAKYSEPNKDIYVPEYYEDHNIFTADLAYLKRCIEAYGLDPDKVLAGIRGYIWKRQPGGQS